MMALNRYRMRHLAKEGHSGAKRATKLLERPDRLLGVILIGNNFVNFSAASLRRCSRFKSLGKKALLGHRSSVPLCFYFRRSRTQNHCSELPRKNCSAVIAHSSLLLLLLWPLVWAVSALSNTYKMLGIQHQNDQGDHLSREELRTLVLRERKLPLNPRT